MTVHGMEKFFFLGAVAVGLVTLYGLLLWRVKQIISERQLKIADQLARLDDAIRVMETRLAEYHAAVSGPETPRSEAGMDVEADSAEEQGMAEDVAPEIKAAIAAAAVTVAGPNAQVRSVKPVSAPAASAWTQQGRVMVQGGHNLRVRQ